MIKLDIPKINLIGDKRSLTELFIILLDNAIKYSSHKEISKALSAKKSPIQKYKFWLKDSGMGIPIKRISIIFLKDFTRVDKSGTKQKNRRIWPWSLNCEKCSSIMEEV